jgi:hypothetical protein
MVCVRHHLQACAFVAPVVDCVCVVKSDVECV